MRDAMDLAYLAGQRVADTLKMDDRDIKDGLLYVRQGKTGYKVRSTRLVVVENGQAMTYSMLRGRFDAAREAAGNIREARDQLGHTTVAMTEQYIRDRKGKKVSPTK
ncbi:hypothetical protein J7302_02655 [Pseudomonas sp. DB1]|uniref:Tyr recombinase domain-containing protein n=1 Tax=Metapseudomonas boanensis TaxID=2822138 RepID=A0ABS5XBH0_9GAMM|nr:hypothetical protein [Pseudomonas boanensis]